MTTSIKTRLGLGLLGAAVVSAAAWWWTAGRDGGGEPGEVAAPDAAFALADCKPRVLDDRSALAVVFTQPLKSGQPLGELIKVVSLGPAEGAAAGASAASGAARKDGAASQVEIGQGEIVRGEWTLGDNPRIAYFPYAPAQRRYRIEIQAGLQSVDGVKLGQAAQCEASSDAMAPSWYFASRGVVLPAGQNGGLPVVTVNQPEVDVQFLRINDDALPRFMEQVAGARRKPADAGDEGDEQGEEDAGIYYDPGSRLQGRVGGWQLDQLRKSSTSVFLSRFRTDERPNRRNVSFLPVENIEPLRQPGVYIAVMGQPGRFDNDYQVTYFYVSDIGLHARRYGDSLQAFATSLKSGKARSGVQFELLDENARVLARAKADGDGRGGFDSLPPAARLLVARDGAEMTVVVLGEPALDLSEFDIGGHLPAATRLFAYAGRDLYRPGETFQLSVLARDADGKPVQPAPLQATLKRPDGRTVATQTWRPRADLPGYVQQAVALPADAQTGTWLLELRADPGAPRADATWPFKVEEFLPERMKLTLQTDAAVLGPDDAFTVAVQGDYLFGAPAAGNRLLASRAVERERQALPRQWPGFVFGDVADDERKQRQELDEQTLDEAGRASVDLTPELDGALSPMRVRGSFSLLETGGRPVVRSIERTVWPAPRLLAVRPLFDRDVAQEGGKAAFELVRVDTQGRVAPLAQAAVRLIREEREYYWRFDDQKGWHSGWTQTDEPVESLTVAIKGRTPLALPVGWGRYRLEVDDPETGLTLRYRFYAGWNAQDAEAIGNRPDRVQIKVEGAPFKPGDDARLLITPPHDGTALVTLEGGGLLWSKRIDVSTDGTQVTIPLDEKWARHDLYATVTAFRPGSQGDRVTPARAVGLVHLPLDRAARKLRVALSAPAKVLPERRTTVRVKVDGLPAGQGAQQAFVTVSAVDVGILNITQYKSPDPVDAFFGKHRYTAELLDIYGKLIEKMEGTTAKLAFGGDANRRDTRSMPKKVKLVDLFSGPVRLNAQGEAVIPLDVPDFNGTLRLMAVAATAERFGSAEAQMVVAAPVVAELSTPRFIAPGDVATLALDVTNLSGAPQTLTVELAGADPVRIREPRQTLALRHQQRATVRFTAEATDAYGLARLTLRLANAAPDGSPAALRITRQSALQVQPAAPLERELRRVKLDPGQSLALEPGWIERFHKGSANVALSVSDKPPLNVQRLVQGLLDYPYGCLEQTTSAAYPHLFIDEAAAQAYGLKPRSREERVRFVDGAMGRIAGMQKHDGGFSLWGDGGYEAWLSAYVMGFLQDAREQGFAVPERLYASAQEGLLQQLRQAPNRFGPLPRSARPDAQGQIPQHEYTLLRDQHRRLAELAHAGYVLARDKKAPLALLRYLHEQRERARSPLPLVHLGLALRLMGDEPRAKVALDEALKRPYGITLKARNDEWAAHEWLGDYGSPVRDLALSYALLVRHDARHARRDGLLFDLAARLGGRQYWSTQERLALLLAARAAGAVPGGKGAEWNAALRIGEAAQGLASRTTEMRSFDAATLARGVALTSQHGQPLFVEIEASGYPLKPPAPRSDAMELKREWFALDGQPWGSRPLKVGDMLIVRLQARARQAIEDGLLVDRIPAGFEVENLNLSLGPQAGEFTVGGVNLAQALSDERVKHREYRDDRFVAAARLGPDWLSVFYMVRVVTPGRYVVPAPYAEDMYRPELRAVGEGTAGIVIADPRGGGVPQAAGVEQAPGVEQAAGAGSAPVVSSSPSVTAPAASGASAASSAGGRAAAGAASAPRGASAAGSR
jgi:uncharacterized protein YfaS (alpha-2-macroglobulin family)